MVQQGLANYGKPGNYFERQIGRWSKQYVASVTQPIAEMDQLMDWLPANMPDSAKDESQVSIVHGDYRLDNVMFPPGAATVIAVLDWELSTLGHPLADFSYHCMAWHIPARLGRGIGGLDIAALGIPGRAGIHAHRTASAQALPRREQLNADWNFYLAYNMFRIAAILQGIAKRVEPAPPPARRPRQRATRRGPWPSWLGDTHKNSAQARCEPFPFGTAAGGSPHCLLANEKEHSMDFDYSPKTKELQATLARASWMSTSTRMRSTYPP